MEVSVDNRSYSRTRPKRPHTGAGWKRPDFAPFAIVFDESVIVKTAFDQELVDALKQVPSQYRAFLKDGRPLERQLREHLEANADYFSGNDSLASAVSQLVDCIADARGLSDAWVVSLVAPELFDWTIGSALKSFPQLQLFDVRVLRETE
jgi:hypothetical protein